MTKTVEEVRRAAFEAWAVQKAKSMSYTHPENVLDTNRPGDYATVWVEGAWLGFNAALDAVEIQFPSPISASNVDRNGYVNPLAEEYDNALEDCKDAIEQTGLGLRVK